MVKINSNKKLKEIFRLKRKIKIILLLFILFCSVNNSESLLTSASAVSNKKISWGIKRNNNHNQPDVGAENKRIIEKYLSNEFYNG